MTPGSLGGGVLQPASVLGGLLLARREAVEPSQGNRVYATTRGGTLYSVGPTRMMRFIPSDPLLYLFLVPPKEVEQTRSEQKKRTTSNVLFSGTELTESKRVRRPPAWQHGRWPPQAGSPHGPSLDRFWNRPHEPFAVFALRGKEVGERQRQRQRQRASEQRAHRSVSQTSHHHVTSSKVARAYNCRMRNLGRDFRTKKPLPDLLNYQI